MLKYHCYIEPQPVEREVHTYHATQEGALEWAAIYVLNNPGVTACVREVIEFPCSQHHLREDGTVSDIPQRIMRSILERRSVDANT